MESTQPIAFPIDQQKDKKMRVGNDWVLILSFSSHTNSYFFLSIFFLSSFSSSSLYAWTRGRLIDRVKWKAVIKKHLNRVEVILQIKNNDEQIVDERERL